MTSSRGHKDFAEGGDPHREAPNTFSTSKTWEPRAAVKGDIARMLFYMEIRYAAQDGMPALTLEKMSTKSDEPRLGFVCTLYDWHAQDPVNRWERRRNNRIEEHEENRNPFIDRPEWVEAIWGPTCQGGNSDLLSGLRDTSGSRYASAGDF